MDMDYNRNPSREDIQNNIAKIQAEILEKQDLRTKEVGDRVKIWDGSGNHDKNTKEHRYGIDELFKSEAIVIATGLSVSNIREYDFQPKYNLDVLLRFPNGEEVYTMSSCISRTDKHKD